MGLIQRKARAMGWRIRYWLLDTAAGQLCHRAAVVLLILVAVLHFGFVLMDEGLK